MIKGYSKTLLFNESAVKYEAIFSNDIKRQGVSPRMCTVRHGGTTEI